MSSAVRQLRSISLAAGALALGGGSLYAQLPIGTVATEDAIVAGTTATGNNRSVLLGNVTITAKDHPAFVELNRGGSVKVCSTSGVHLTAGNPIIPTTPQQEVAASTKNAISPTETATAASPEFPLMVSLDRGAAELRANVLSSDVLMTPDLKVSFSEPGPLDLRIRVANNGDTCVENRVAGLGTHPTLQIGSLFGSDNYRVLPGQHVMFEHGNLREVVDNESSPCGCPEQPVKTIEAVPDISLLPATKAPTPPHPEAQYPFPAAISQGLAPPPPVPQAEPGVVHTQVSAILAYKADQPPPITAPTPQPPVEKQPNPKKSGFFRGVGHFFKKVFGGN